MQPLRLHWEGKELGWVLDTDIHISDGHLRFVLEKSIPIQIERWRGLPPGDIKDDLEYAIKLLQNGNVKQWIRPIDGFTTGFKSTVKETSKTIIYMGD